MVCPNCRSNVSDKRIRCDRCGQDLEIYKKVYRVSNMYYNQGLAKARVRDLSGAIIALRKSLELNKLNTNARNLLGLIYFEMGETVAALSEWVISKHFQPDNNDADRYINSVQENPTKLDNLNQAIKRYNNALSFAKQGSDDLAIIQLKRVLQLNPNFIRAYHLISLLYMKNGEREKAKKCLSKAARIDVNNTTTLRYLKELEPQTAAGKEGDASVNDDKDATSSIMPVTSYREEKPNVMAFVNLIIGVLIGLAVAAFLIFPTIKNKDANNDVARNHEDYSAGLAALEEKDAIIEQLQNEKDELETTVATLRAEFDSIIIPEVNPNLYDSLFEISSLLTEEFSKEERDRDFKQIAEKLRLLDTSMYETDAALQLADKFKQMVYPIASEQFYDTGHDIYGEGRYEEALQYLLQAYYFNPDNYDAIYFIGRAYHRLQDYDNAKIYYELIVNNFQDTRRYDSAKSYLGQIQD